MSELAAEVCREHRASNCGACDEHNDDLWVHPRDLPLPHADCPLCDRLRSDRQWRIDELQRTITLLGDEIVEIERGMRHTAYHESQRASNIIGERIGGENDSM
jgi:hypothetical protein